MAPKSGEKKPAKKVVKKTGASAGDKKKKVSRKAVESYKIYIYKVGFCAPACGVLRCGPADPGQDCIQADQRY